MIPQFDEIRIQILKELRDGKVLTNKELIAPLATHFELSKEEQNAQYPSNNAKIFPDRISWALSYLFISGLVERPQRGHYKISEKGLDMLSVKTDEEINKFVHTTVNAISKERSKKKKNKNSTPQSTKSEEQNTPAQELYDTYERIKQNIKSEILTTILSKQSQEFEKLLIKLLQAMGYGGEVKDSGIVTKFSRDGGIDGVIREDILGFNHISIQAKRYALNSKVGSGEVRSFVGAVTATPSKKGVFITTSDYSKEAIEYVKNLTSPTIILINGQELAEYMYEYGVGLQTSRVLKIRKLDMDFWDEMENDTSK